MLTKLFFADRQTLCIIPEFQRRGLGTKLLDWCIGVADDREANVCTQVSVKFLPFYGRACTGLRGHQRTTYEKIPDALEPWGPVEDDEEMVYVLLYRKWRKREDSFDGKNTRSVFP